MANNNSCNADDSKRFEKSDFNFPNFDEFTSSFGSSQNNENNFNDTSNSNNSFSNIDINTILKMKKIMDSMNVSNSNPRSILLQSLKPYLRPERRPKVDQYIQLFNMGTMMENMKFSGGENKE